MPFGSEGKEAGIAVALSGGGFRAALFHLGGLWRLTELGVLPRIARMSSVSGGSIVSGVLAANWPAFAATPTVATFRRLIEAPLRTFCGRNIDATAVAGGLFNPWKSAGEVVEGMYAELLGAATLADLPEAPRFVFNSTNLQTGRTFRFSRPYMGDYRLGLIRNPTVKLAKAVAASSAFPPVLSPVVLDKPGKFEAVEGSDLNGKPEFTERICVADGGVYDNLALETVWNRYQTLLVSDAGSPFTLAVTPETDWIRQAMRALDVATDQARSLRKRALIGDFTSGARQGAYWGIASDIASFRAPDGEADTALACAPAKVGPLATIRTRLNPFDDREQEELINWGYAICDAALRRHAPEVISGRAPAPGWPYPGRALGP
ncbi:MAG: patatin-like phospholipase family protein [Bauldia sp.]